MTRLDKYLCDSGILTRSEASRAVRSGRVAVNGVQMRDPSAKIDEKTASAELLNIGSKLMNEEFP